VIRNGEEGSIRNAGREDEEDTNQELRKGGKGRRMQKEGKKRGEDMVTDDGDVARKDMPDRDLTEQIISAAIAVHRELGPGFLESVYEEALCIELEFRQIPFQRQRTVMKAVKVHTGLLLNFAAMPLTIKRVARENASDAS
jgi:hypothetical protein